MTNYVLYVSIHYRCRSKPQNRIATIYIVKMVKYSGSYAAITKDVFMQQFIFTEVCLKSFIYR